jgi:hypothetical protein
MKIVRSFFSVFILAIVLLFAVLGLSGRWEAERAHRQFGLVVETTEVQSLARQSRTGSGFPSWRTEGTWNRGVWR